MSTKQEESCNLFIKNLYFEKKVPKVKKYFHLNFLTTFQKTFKWLRFTLKKKPIELQVCLNLFWKQCHWCMYVYVCR